MRVDQTKDGFVLVLDEEVAQLLTDQMEEEYGERASVTILREPSSDRLLEKKGLGVRGWLRSDNGRIDVKPRYGGAFVERRDYLFYLYSTFGYLWLQRVPRDTDTDISFYLKTRFPFSLESDDLEAEAKEQMKEIMHDYRKIFPLFIEDLTRKWWPLNA